MKYYTFILFIFSYFTSAVFCQSDIPIYLSVNNGDTKLVKEFIKSNDINAFYGPDSISLLGYAIESGQYKTTKILIKKGADLNHIYRDQTPLIHSSLRNNYEICRLLLKKGADPDYYNSKKNTPLFYTASSNNLEMSRLLINNGATPDFKNSANLTPENIATIYQNFELAQYFKLEVIHKYSRYYPDYFDGPYIRWTDNDNANICYLARDSLKNSVKKIKKTIKIKNSNLNFKGFGNDNGNYTFYKNKSRPPDHFENVNKIMALGDIHGQYEKLISFLKAANIIDKKLNWAWKDGHLVFMGDIFDRGEKVTECFWLIYKLEKQARDAGGQVHLLLGNHEIMILENDIRYISNKYLYLCEYLGVSYSDLYAEDTEFGKWLRSKNTMIKINDLLFVHGGISPNLINQNLSIAEINDLISDYVNDYITVNNVDQINFLLGSTGPFWYRGYFKKNNNYPLITDKELDDILEYFGASSILVGHSTFAYINSYYDGKVFALDVSDASDEIILQGLFIKKNEFYRTLFSGTIEKIE